MPFTKTTKLLEDTITEIRIFQLINGFWPVSSELARQLGISQNAADIRMRKSEEFGLIKRGKGQRNIEIL